MNENNQFSKISRKICCFAGHSKIYESGIYERVCDKVALLVEKYGVNEFWAGNYGGFDRTAASAVRKVKAAHPEIELNLIIPYLTKNIELYREQYYELYDNILLADMPENTPAKFKIIKTNEYMIKSSDFLICYVKYGCGGAAKTLEFAERKGNITIFRV